MSPPVGTESIEYASLLVAAPDPPPAWTAGQATSAAGHVISVLPITAIRPGTFATYRGAKGRSAIAG